MEIKLTKAEIRKVKDVAPDYIDWFSAIENAILSLKPEEESGL